MRFPIRYLPLAVIILAGGWIFYTAILPKDAQDKMNVREFGRLPVVYGGRVKPFDTLARNSLTIIADQDTFTDSRYFEPIDKAYEERMKQEDYSPAPKVKKGGKGRPAIEWFLDVISSNPHAAQHPIFRIQNLDVLKILELKRRKGFRYSMAEIEPRLMELEKAANDAQRRRQNKEKLEVVEVKTIELIEHIYYYMRLRESFGIASIRPETAQQDIRREIERIKELEKGELPHAIPPAKAGDEWSIFRKAALMAQFEQADEPLIHLAKILDARNRELDKEANVAAAYDPVKAFNEEVAAYKQWLSNNPPKGIDMLYFETFYNHAQPFYTASVLSLFAFLLGAAGWLLHPTHFMKATHFLMMKVFALATFGITARVLISGYPPITNLYGTAIFIGWAAILTGLILEHYKPIGIGNFVGSIVGFITLLVAHFLAGDGDTLEMMQAVLDTKFWLATHVIIINLGYTATYFAGFMGIVYVIQGVFTKRLDKDARPMRFVGSCGGRVVSVGCERAGRVTLAYLP